MQAVIEKASIDEVYIDVTALVDNELQVRSVSDLLCSLQFCTWDNLTAVVLEQSTLSIPIAVYAQMRLHLAFVISWLLFASA